MSDAADGESLLPQNRTLKMFREWFDVHIYSMVWDLADEPLLVEDWSDDIDIDDDLPDGMLH